MALITLLSDFGSASPYPAAMRVVLARHIQATMIDISHDVPPHDVRTGAYLLQTVVPHTPAGTVHLAVVDPGVGTERRALIVSAGGQFMVGPDNGLLMPAARRLGAPRAFAIIDEALAGAVRSGTFHGRDLFAPAAALLATGTPPTALGAPAAAVVDLDFGQGHRQGRALIGVITYVDPFGNLITNIPSGLLPQAARRVLVQVGAHRARGTVGATYGGVRRGSLVALPGSDGVIEVAVRDGRAARVLAARAGARIRIHERAG